MNLRPTSDMIVVKVEKKEETTGGIVIPDIAKKKPRRGVVMACGPGKINRFGVRLPITVKKGDTVLFSQLAGHEFSFDRVNYNIMREDDVLAIEEE